MAPETPGQEQQEKHQQPGSPEVSAAADSQFRAGPMAGVVALLQSSLQLARDTADLLAVEMELAARSLALLIAFSLLLAALAVLVWILLLAAFGSYLKAGLEFSWLSTFLVLALLNGVLGALLWRLMMRLSRRLGLPGFRRALRTAEQVSEQRDS